MSTMYDTNKIGIQHHYFNGMGEFSTWKEDEEARNHTFYILHDKPYIMPTTGAEGMINGLL